MEKIECLELENSALRLDLFYRDYREKEATLVSRRRKILERIADRLEIDPRGYEFRPTQGIVVPRKEVESEKAESDDPE